MPRSGASTASCSRRASWRGEYATLKDDLEGARELLDEGEDEELRKVVEEAPARLGSSKRRSAWRWSSATPTTTRT